MKQENKKTAKSFDAIKAMRKIRDELSAEIRDMNYDQERAYLDKLLASNQKMK